MARFKKYLNIIRGTIVPPMFLPIKKCSKYFYLSVSLIGLNCCQRHLSQEKKFLISLTANCIDSTNSPDVVFANEVIFYVNSGKQNERVRTYTKVTIDS